MRMKLPLKQDTRYARHSVTVYSEPFPVSEVELFAKTVNASRPLETLPAKCPPWVFDRVLSTPLVSLSYTYERGRVLGVDPFHKNGFKFSVYFHLVF